MVQSLPHCVKAGLTKAECTAIQRVSRAAAGYTRFGAPFIRNASGTAAIATTAII